MSTQISETPISEDVKTGITWIAGLGKALDWIVYIVLPLIVLLGSSYLLVLSSMSRFNRLAFVIVIFVGSVGAIIGLFYLIENVRLMLESKQGRFYFGLGKDIRRLSGEEILFLTSLANRSYITEKNNTRPSLDSTIRNIFNWKSLLLATIGAFAGYILPFSSSWSILVGMLMGIFAPYPILVVYDFFCSYMQRYKYRSEFVRKYLEDERFHQKITEQVNQTASKSDFLAPLDYIWNSFSLELPVCAGLVAFVVAKVPIIILGLLIGSAVLPFIGLTVASISGFQLFIYLFGFFGWTQGFQYSLEAMHIFIEWGFPHTISDFVILAIIAYGLGVLNIPYQVQRSGLATLPSTIVSFLLAPVIPIVGWICFPFFWILSLGRLKYNIHNAVAIDSFQEFWIRIIYLLIIYAVINAVLRYAAILIQYI